MVADDIMVLSQYEREVRERWLAPWWPRAVMVLSQVVPDILWKLYQRVVGHEPGPKKSPTGIILVGKF